MTIVDFYDQLAPFYHLIYPDWEASIKQQAAALDSIIKEFWGDKVRAVLDVACGIGTQTLGLAALGYHMTASDLSSAEIKRAERQAGSQGLDINFSVADMRQAYTHHQKQFDLILAADNAVPHLLSDEHLLAAFQQFYQCTRPGGGCLITVRDYANEDCTGIQIKSYGLRTEGTKRYLIFQVWEFQGQIYDLSMYFVEDQGGPNCITHVMRSHYYAVSTDKLISLMTKAGFQKVQRLDNRFFQPVIIGQKETQ